MSEQMMSSTPRAVTEEERPFWDTVARLYREYGTEEMSDDVADEKNSIDGTERPGRVSLSSEQWHALQAAASDVYAEENRRNFPHGFVAAVIETLERPN